MHRLVCLSQQLLEVADFVMTQEDNLLGQELKSLSFNSMFSYYPYFIGSM